MTNGSYPKSSKGTLDGIWEDIIAFNDRHFPDWRTEDLRIVSNALAGEVGEICDKTKHHYGGGTNPIFVNTVSVSDIAEECFDSLVYMILLLGAMGFDRESFIEESRKKVAILYERMARD